MVAYYLHLRKHSPQEGEYNPLQKMAYTSVFVILTPLVLLSGMAMSPQLNVAFNWLPAAFGGRQSARAVHFILAFGFLSFTFGHVFMVLTQGVFNNMRSMTTGWYREKLPPAIQATESAPALEPVDAEALKAEADNVQPEVQAPSQTTLPADTTAKPAQAENKSAANSSVREEETEKNDEVKS
jgi:ABC-type lipoprotein release transport system permease subunit